ncbi:DNA adenine methylase [Litorimonas sp. WD9-15]|uniref:DNA adenine methylase n=1 Tax=Litorimonas sp. WD9-15 TaxID=3418716 RepID=UPI003CFE15DB
MPHWGCELVKSACRYHGAKWMLAPWIIDHLPPHQVFVEAFAGSAAVLLRKPRSYAEVMNDLDDGVVNLFRVLRDPAQAAALREAITLTPFSRVEFDLARDMSTDLDAVEFARRFLVRSFQGHSSASVHKSTGFRSNSNRSGSTPAQDWARWPDRVTALVERLRGVVIEQRDFEPVLRSHDAAATVSYIDPPYVSSTRDAGTDYFHEFTDADHVRLAGVLHDLTGMVVLSGYQSEIYADLFGDWQRVDRPALADGARPRLESLWLNPAASDALARARGGQIEMFG